MQTENSIEIPDIDEKGHFNLLTSIWIVPFIALLIASWLAYQYFSQLGPQIRLIFPTNEGLKAGQSPIKYKNVPIGIVENIKLQEEGDGVIVTVRMDKSATSYINSKTKFWIVKPEVGFGGVSGLDTLISGTYINIYTDKNTKEAGVILPEYHGLTHTFRKNEEGEYLVLNAPLGYNISEGTPLYFKNIRVGKIEYVTIGIDGKSVDFIAYVDQQYVPYVHTDSQFWVMSALDIDVSNGRLDVNMAPLSNLVTGGIAFSSRGADITDTIPDSFVFHLHKNGSVADGKKVGRGGKSVRMFELIVKDSISKLKIDASVRFEGFDVGHVSNITTSYNKKAHKMRGNVVIEIDTSFFEDSNDESNLGTRNFYKAVRQGLRARITPTDPLTGMLFVDLVFDENSTKEGITKAKPYNILPTVIHQDNDIMGKVETLLASLTKVIEHSDEVVTELKEPLQTLLLSLNKTMQNLDTMTAQKSFKQMPNEVTKTLRELTQTLKETKKVMRGYNSQSLISKQLAETLKALTQTSTETQQFLKMLNRKPNSLIFGDK